MREIFIVEKPPVYPYLCMRCRRSDGNMIGFVDTGIELEYDGVVYFCFHCADDFVKAYPGGILIDQLDKLETDYKGRLEEAQRILASYAQMKSFWLAHGLDIEEATKFSGPLLKEPTKTTPPVGGSEATVAFSVPVLENITEMDKENGNDGLPDDIKQSVDVSEQSASGDSSKFDPTSINFDKLLTLD